MNNKKGFTLTELLAVLIVLILLMTLAFPNFSSLSNSANSKYDKSTEVIIRSAARMYVSNHVEEVERQIEKSANKKICVPIGKLIAYEYLDSDIKDSKNVTINENRCVLIEKKSNESKTEYSYEVSTDLASKYGISDYKPPVITMSGINCSNNMNINSIDDFNSCTVSVVDNVDSTKPFKSLKERETDNNLSKVVTQEDNKIFITYNATDSAGNTALPLHVQLIINQNN